MSPGWKSISPNSATVVASRSDACCASATATRASCARWVLAPASGAGWGMEGEPSEPQGGAVVNYVYFYGRDAFYGSTDLRHKCCDIRKVEPLARALAGKRAWITGQRREQAPNRAE